MRPISSLILDGVDSDSDEYGSFALLTIEELREAAGVTGSAQDAELIVLGDAVADIIGNHCKRRAAEGSRPTVMAQLLVETFHIASPVDSLVLARWPVQEVSIVADATGVLSSDGYSVFGGTGVLRKATRTQWSIGTVEVSYVGGFVEVPPAIKYAAKAMLRVLQTQEEAASRDTTIRSISREGIGAVTYATGENASSSTQTAVPQFIANLLAPYTDQVV